MLGAALELQQQHHQHQQHHRGRLEGLVLRSQLLVLLQRRHRAKYHSGGLWANSCCGHPRPGETTLAAARRQNATGVFRLERSAKSLLKDFHATAKRATMLLYQRQIGKTAAAEQMVPARTFLSQIEFDNSPAEG